MARNGLTSTARKLSKYGVFFGPRFPVFSTNTGKYKPEKALHLDTFHGMILTLMEFYMQTTNALLQNTYSENFCKTLANTFYL